MHVSIKNGLDQSIDNAEELGCSAFQIFTRNPRGWAASPLLKKDIANFQKRLEKSRIDRLAVAAHMPYLPNFSSPDKVPYARSLKSLIEEAKRCSQLGIPFLVAHLGSHKGMGESKGIETMVKAFVKAANQTPDNVTFLLENNVGFKDNVGSDFKKISLILSKLKPVERFGVCFDTCHAFTAGYDMKTTKSVDSTLKKFDEAVGLHQIKLIHLNDSKGILGCGIDRHEHLGWGLIGEAGLRRVIKFANSEKIPMILETPIDERCDDVGNMKKATELAN